MRLDQRQNTVDTGEKDRVQRINKGESSEGKSIGGLGSLGVSTVGHSSEVENSK